jgi:hypothetical protein
MNQWEQFFSLAAIGALGYLGKLLIGKNRLGLRNIIGSGIVGGTLGTIATLLLLQFPSTPFIVVAGAAAAIATIGHELFKEIVGAFVYKWTGKDLDKDQ